MAVVILGEETYQFGAGRCDPLGEFIRIVMIENRLQKTWGMEVKEELLARQPIAQDHESTRASITAG
jgi:hypothetical protein